MRTTLNIDDPLYEEAARLTGVKEKTALIQRESTRRLAKRGGGEPCVREVIRRRRHGSE